MRNWVRSFGVGAATLCVAVFALGCETSSHKTVKTYEYDDQPKPKRSESNQLDSEYKMQSEGEMVSPGTMSDGA